MAKFLNNIDLNKNQLIKAVIHPLSTAPANPVVGQVYYDNEDASIYVCTVTSEVNAGSGGGTTGTWKDLGGDVTGITLTGGNGITATNTNSSGGAYSSTLTLDISDSTLTTATAIAQADLLAFSDESETGQPTGNITFSNLEDQIFGNISGDATIAAAGALTLAAAQTNITSVYNTALKVGGDAETMIDFSTSNEIHFKINNTDELKLTGAALIPIVDNGLDLGTSALGFRHLYLANNANSNVGSHLTFNKDRNGDGTAGQDGDDIGQFHFHSFNDASTPEAIQYGRIRAEIDDASDGSEAGRMTLSVRAKDSIANGLKIVGSDSTDGVVDVTLGSGAASTTTIAGNLIVSGDTISANVGTLDVEDKNITLNKSDGDSSSMADGAGITIQDAVDASNDATMLWDQTNSKFAFSHAIAANVTGALTGNASTATSAAGLSATLAVGSGGTGQVTFPEKSIILGNTTNGFTNLSIGTAGQVLTVDSSGGLAWSANTGSVAAATVIVAELSKNAQNEYTDTENFVLLSNDKGDGNAHSVKTNEPLTYNPQTGTITANASTATLAATATNLAANTTVAVPVGTVELGHATDTTIARSAGGKATIEGNLIGVVKTFALNDTSPCSSNNNGAASTVFTITHGMGNSFYYKVEVILNSGSYDTVFADIARPTNATITVTFAANVALNAYAAMVTRMA